MPKPFGESSSAGREIFPAEPLRQFEMPEMLDCRGHDFFSREVGTSAATRAQPPGIVDQRRRRFEVIAIRLTSATFAPPSESARATTP